MLSPSCHSGRPLVTPAQAGVQRLCFPLLSFQSAQSVVKSFCFSLFMLFFSALLHRFKSTRAQSARHSALDAESSAFVSAFLSFFQLFSAFQIFYPRHLCLMLYLTLKPMTDIHDEVPHSGVPNLYSASRASICPMITM